MRGVENDTAERWGAEAIEAALTLDVAEGRLLVLAVIQRTLDEWAAAELELG